MRFKCEVFFFRSKTRKIERGIAEKKWFLEIACLMYGIVFWQHLLMGGELDDETCNDVLLVSSALPPPNFTLIGNDDFYTNLWWKIWCCWVFADISARSSREKKTNNFSYQVYFFSLQVQCCVRVSASNFQVLARKNGWARALGSIVRFLAGPARRQMEGLNGVP